MRAMLACLACLVTPILSAQAPAPRLDWWSEDSARVASIRANGQTVRYPHVVVWAPKDSLEPAAFRRLADSLARAVTALRSLVGRHQWQRIGDRPVVYFLSPGRFISHATAQDTVFIALRHMSLGWAPYLHEAAHELLFPAPPFGPYEYGDSIAGERAAERFPYWLAEGLPDYLAQTVAASTGFGEGDVFTVGGVAGVDSTCAARLATHPLRPVIEAKIGGQGRLEALFTEERETVAPTFYACSYSFTAFLVKRIGLPPLIDLFRNVPARPWDQELEARAGVPAAALRREWLAKIGLE